MDRVTHTIEGVANNLLNMGYHEWEVNIHNVYDQKLIGHVRYRQHPNENSSGGAKPTDGSQHEGCTKLVRIIGSSKEVRFMSHPIFRRKPNASHMCARITISHI
jgi:hypothetical protein